MRVHQPDARIGDDARGKHRHELVVVEDFPAGLVNGVRDDLELDVEDHPEEAVASDYEVEETRIPGAADVANGPVRQHHAHRSHGPADGSRAVVHAVRVHRDGAAHGEDVGGLHRLHRPLRVDGLLDVVPRRSAVDADHAPARRG